MYRRFCVLLAAVALPLRGAGDVPPDRATLRGVMFLTVGDLPDRALDSTQKEGVHHGGTADAGLQEK